MHRFPFAPTPAAVAVTLALGALPSLHAAEAARPAAESTLAEVQVSASGPARDDRLVTQARAASVGKSPVSIQDTPFAMSVIDVEQIRDTGAKNVQDALLYSAGVYAGRYGFDTRGDWSSIRGLNGATYLDGLRSLYGSYNNVRPEIHALERIELLKGPASVLYGQADLGGIVNVVSKRPQATAARAVEVQVGSHDRRQIAADLTGPLSADGTWLYRLVALTRDAGTQVDHVNDDARLFMPSLTWQPSAATRLTVQYVHQQNHSRVSAQFLPARGTLLDAPLGRIPTSRFVGEPGWDRYDTQKNEVSLFFDQRLAEGWKFAATVRRTDSASVTREHWTTVGAVPDDAGNMTRTIHTADRKTDVLNGDFRLEGDFRLGPTRHRVALGVDRQEAFWEEYNYASVGTGGGTINVYRPVYGQINHAALAWADRPDNRIVQTGVYAMDHIEWGSWVLSAALRRDRARNEVDNVGSTPDAIVRNSATTGRVGLMYRFANGVSPYVSYSEAFVPNLGTDGSAAAGYLKPTTGSQREGGVKYLSETGNTSAAAAWFDIEEKNRIAQGAVPGGVEQLGASTRGWELEVRHRVGRLELLANTLRMDAVNATTGKRLSSIAEQVHSGWAQYLIGDGWRAGIGARYLGSVTGGNGAPVLPTVTLYDAMIGYRTGAWDFRLDVKNLGDKTYVSWCRGVNQDCGYGERLTALLTARYRF